MSNIKELVDRLCPDGVPFKTLGEIAYYPKERINIKRLPNGLYVSVENLLKDKGGMIPAIEIPAVHDVIMFEKGDILVGNIRPYLRKIWHADQAGGTNGDVVLIRINKAYSEVIKARYLYHILASEQFFFFANQYAKGAKMPRGDKSKILEYTIPIPPIEVQEEIVRILDKFSACVAELQRALKEELQARKEQYEYYRNLLLTFNRADDEQETNVTPWGGVSYKVIWKALGEVCEKTHKIKWKENPQKNYFYIDLTSVDCDTHRISNQLTMIDSLNAPSRAQQIVITNDVLFGTTRPTLMRLTIVPPHLNDQICSTGFAILRANTKIILPKYLYFILNTNRFLSFADKNQEGAGYPSISLVKLNKFRIPIPPIKVQEEIVGVLDKFEALVNDLTQGLPAEIAAQQERYEYYRNKLLTFKEQQ